VKIYLPLLRQRPGRRAGGTRGHATRRAVGLLVVEDDESMRSLSAKMLRNPFTTG
jgi:hypothetical protein